MTYSADMPGKPGELGSKTTPVEGPQHNGCEELYVHPEKGQDALQTLLILTVARIGCTNHWQKVDARLRKGCRVDIALTWVCAIRLLRGCTGLCGFPLRLCSWGLQSRFLGLVLEGGHHGDIELTR